MHSKQKKKEKKSLSPFYILKAKTSKVVVVVDGWMFWMEGGKSFLLQCISENALKCSAIAMPRNDKPRRSKKGRKVGCSKNAWMNV